MSKKIGLALGGGGACGIAHIGVLRALEENDIPIDIIAGTSMGGIVGGLYAAGMSLSDMEQVATGLTLFSLMDLDPLFLRGRGLLRGRKVENILHKCIEAVDFNEVKIPFACTAVDVQTAKLTALSEGELIPALLATSAIPGVFRPVEIDGRLYVDGGILERVPADLAREMGADVVIGVDVQGDPRTLETQPETLLDMFQRVMSIMDWEIFKTRKDRPDLLLTVEQCDVNQMDTKNLDKSVVYGYETAIDAMNRIKDLISD